MVEREDTSLFEDILDDDRDPSNGADEHHDERDEGHRFGASRRQWLVLLGGFVVFLVCVIVALLLVRSSFAGDDEGVAVPWRDPVVDGTTVTVTFDRSPCASTGETTVDESDTEVVVTVREVPRPTLCSSPGDVAEETIELDAPLGDRPLVDGSY